MRLNDIRSAEGARKAAKRIGRGAGSGTGKTSGKGHKGQKARSGGGVRPGFEGGQMPLQMRLPKFGFSSRVARTTEEVRLSELNKIEGSDVNIVSLKDAGLIRKSSLRARIIASGSIDKAYTVSGVHATKGAKEAIEAAGGSVSV